MFRKAIHEFKNWRFVIPKNNIGFGWFHPKIMLIKFSDVLRVVRIKNIILLGNFICKSYWDWLERTWTSYMVSRFL